MKLFITTAFALCLSVAFVARATLLGDYWDKKIEITYPDDDPVEPIWKFIPDNGPCENQDCVIGPTRGKGGGHKWFWRLFASLDEEVENSSLNPRAQEDADKYLW